MFLLSIKYTYPKELIVMIKRDYINMVSLPILIDITVSIPLKQIRTGMKKIQQEK